MIWAADYVGLPYLKYGRDKSGLDCWGLVRLVYREQRKTELESLSEFYQADARSDFFARVNETFEKTAKKWRKVDIPQAFDIAAFHMHGMIRHVGIVIDEKAMLHVEDKKGACIERHGRRDLYGYYRHS